MFDFPVDQSVHGVANSNRRKEKARMANNHANNDMSYYEHFIYGPTEHALTRVAEDLTAAGYRVPGPPEHDSWREDRDPACAWELMAYGSLDKAFAETRRDDIETACNTHGAHYSGGGSYL